MEEEHKKNMVGEVAGLITTLLVGFRFYKYVDGVLQKAIMRELLAALRDSIIIVIFMVGICVGTYFLADLRNFIFNKKRKKSYGKEHKKTRRKKGGGINC